VLRTQSVRSPHLKKGEKGIANIRTTKESKIERLERVRALDYRGGAIRERKAERGKHSTTTWLPYRPFVLLHY